MSRNQILAVLFGMMVVFAAKAVDFPYQCLTYDINYHYSFIDKNAASATVQISDYNGEFNAILGGKSDDICGIIYCLNDTLQSSFTPAGMTSTPAAENIAFRSGYYRKPHADNPGDPDSPYSYRNINGGGYLSADPATMECVNLTTDMLCMFYYAKTVDFANMPQGENVNIPIRMDYGGERTLQINYQGLSDWRGRTAYKLIANFTYDGSFSAYPITVLIDTELRIPVEFAADIAIGQVQMQYRF